MADKKGIDIIDSDASELSPLEEVDLDDQMEILPDEKDKIEPAVELQDGSVDQKAADISVEPDSDTINEEKLPLEQDDEQNESTGQKDEAENSLATAEEEDEEEFDLDEFDDDDFLGLDDEEFDEKPLEETDPSSEKVTMDSTADGQSEKVSEKSDKAADDGEDSRNKKKASEKTAKKTKDAIALKKPSSTLVTIALTLLVLITAGGFIYANPSLVGLTRESNSAPPEMAAPTPPVQTTQKQVETPILHGKNEIYLTKLEDAGHLRDELLEKKEEIYRLKLHYQSGITDLEEQINREMQKEGITSYAQALKKKNIELNLRTIQRRRSYIDGLEKPTQWIKQGSEEILYLKRKAEFDLQLVDIAAGIDMDRHMRHIAAAIQQYQPCAEKLAVDRNDADLLPLEVIWGQLRNKKKNTGQALPSAADEKITKEICSGNFEHIQELTSISVETAKCLSKMNGSDLFLNGLTALSPAAAKYLFQWSGSWICINGVKELSPAAAQYLFKWKGSWISLNSLIEFPPELAAYLMEWEGNQLELMGLQYNKNNVDQKALKYLALWETTGGKLFISEDVRKEMKRVMR